MRRPIIFLLVPFMIGHLAFVSISWSVACFIIYCGCLMGKENVFKVVLLTLVGLMMGLVFTQQFYDHQLKLSASWDKTISFKGIFYEASPLDETSGSLLIESNDPNLNNRRVKLYWSKNYKGSLPLSGSRISLEGSFKAPEFARNRYRFNERLYMASQGYCGTVFVKAFQVEEGGKFSEKIRAHLLAKSVQKLLAYTAFNQGEIAVGMLLGVDDNIDEGTQEAFKKTGLMHLLSISGAHFAVLFYYLNELTRRISGRYTLRKIAQYSCILGFVWLIGYPMAAIRALLMYFILEWMRRFRRQPDGLSALCICLMLILLFNPFALWDIGLQLASLAMLAIFGFVPLCHQLLGIETLKQKHLLNAAQNPLSPVSKWLIKRLEEIYTGFLVSLVMMPLLTYYFNQVQWAGVLFGPLLTLLATAFLPLGALILLLPFDFMSTAFGSLSGLLLKLMSDLSQGLAQLIHNPSMASGGSLTVGLLVISLGLIIAYKQRSALGALHSQPFMVVTFCLSILITAVELPQFCSPLVIQSWLTQRAQVIALDVGQGDSTLMISPEGKTILIDAGPATARLKAHESLLSLGIKQIDLLVLSHPHDDHYGGMPALTTHLRIKNFVYYKGNYSESAQAFLSNFISEAQQRGTLVKAVSQGDTLTVDKSSRLSVLWPPKDYNHTDENDQSLVVLYGTQKLQLLMTGDISSQVEYDIIKLVPERATLLKLAHHGSRYSNSAELLSHPGLVFAFGQAGKGNRYKHPHQDTIERLEAENLNYLSTHESGAIFMTLGEAYIYYTNERLRTQGLWR